MTKTIDTFMRVKLGSGPQTGQATEIKLISKGFTVAKGGHWGSNILEHPDYAVSQTRKEVELVVVTALDLGSSSNGGVTLDEMFALAANFGGLQICPPEIGPLVRMNYANQPLNDWLRVAMKPIEGNIFRIAHDTGRLIIGGCAEAQNNPSLYNWNIEHKWIFMKSD